MRLHHVQVSCPAGGEDPARRFYGKALGIPEVEEPFHPAKKAHPAFVVPAEALDALAARLEESGFPTRWDGDLPGYRRFYTSDGNGNRAELLADA